MRSFGRRIRPGVRLLRGTVQTIWIAIAPLTAVALLAGYAPRCPPNFDQTIVDGPSQNNDDVTALCPAVQHLARHFANERRCIMSSMERVWNAFVGAVGRAPESPAIALPAPI